MKVKWVKETPTEEGWYWMKYKGNNGPTVCPAYVTIFNAALKGCVLVRTARNVSFVAGPNHGGPELKCPGEKPDKTIRFGPKIEVPE